MSADPVVVRTYPTEIAADLARMALDAEGITALVQSQDAAGLLRGQGVELIVRRDELDLALRILDEIDSEPA